MHQARDLAKEIEDLTHTLEPLRQEKNRLKQYLDQARHSTAVRNEQILDQKLQITDLKNKKSELEDNIVILNENLTDLQKRKEEKSGELLKLVAEFEDKKIVCAEEINSITVSYNEKCEIAKKEYADQCENHSLKLNDLLRQMQEAKIQLENILARKSESLAELAVISGRKEAIQRELDNLAARLPAKKANHKKTAPEKIMPVRSGRLLAKRKAAERNAGKQDKKL